MNFKLLFLFKKLLTLIASIVVVFFVVYYIILAAGGKSLSIKQRGGKIVMVSSSERFFKKESVISGYFSYLKQIITMDLGESYYFGLPVKDIVLDRLKNTVILNFFALFLLFVIGISLGIFSAFFKNLTVRFLEIFFFVLYAVPDFILAIFLIIVFSLTLGWFPSSGMVSLGHEQMSTLGKILDYFNHIFLIALSLTLSSIIFLARFTDSSITQIMNDFYMLSLKVRGVDTFSNKLKHIMKNAIFPFISLLTFIIPSLVSGAIIIETIFGYPGIGQVFFKAVSERDYPLILAVSFINVSVIFFSIFITDILYLIFDPRVSNEELG